jgi:acyl carrier protein
LSRSLQPVPIGAVGEICIGGSGVTRGYLNHPAKTGAKFVPDPFGGVPGERLYASGDMARWAPSGGLDFVGREDHQVKIRGFRIELGEIDAVLSRHPGILETAVVAREDDPGERRLVAYLVPRQEPAPGVDQMLGFLREQLPEHMVPSAFVILEAFPRLANGKIDRRALPAPTGHRPELQKKLVAPRTELEATLAELWREVLKLDEVGIDDNFFDLGGNSLLMVQIHRLHRERLGPDISITDLFQFPTIASLARHLSRHDGAPSPDSAQQHSERMEARGAAVRHQGSRRAALRQQGAPR